jgi:mono/diheme cytochrome c family protein
MQIRFVAVVAVVGLTGLALQAQETKPEGSVWEVPEEAKAVGNPVEGTPEAVAAGAGLYKKHCLMCHGETGKGDGPATKFMKPAPPDMTTPGTKGRMTDGEIFYKVSTGKRPMPPMNRKLSETERWQVVHYLRTLQQ